MDIFFAGMDWLPTVLGAVIAYALGWVWYSPKLFAYRWLDGVGLSVEDMTGPPIAAMAVQALGTFLLAWMIGLAFANAMPALAIVAVGALIVLLASSGLYTQKKWSAIVIEVGYVLVMTAVMVGAHITYVTML
jgi:4-hydroxybenzoate polyprenyltransferase